MLFTELPFLERFQAAADAGFAAVEYQLAYDFDKADLKSALSEANMDLVLHNLPAGDWAGGDRGIAANPDRVAEFKQGVELAVEHASHLGSARVNCLAGIAPDGAGPRAVRTTRIETLK